MDNEVLNNRLYDAWMRGIFKNMSKNALGPKRQYDCRRVEGGEVLTKINGAEQVLWFDGTDRMRDFNVFTNVDPRDAAERVKAATEERIEELTEKQRGEYEEIFGKHKLYTSSHFYDKTEHSGVGIHIPLRELPQGERGGLGGRLFDYAYNLYALPALTVVWKQPIKGRSWRVFDRPQHQDPRKK